MIHVFVAVVESTNGATACRQSRHDEIQLMTNINIATMPVRKLKEVYLIGVVHDVQWDNSLSLTKDFKRYLAQKIKGLKVRLIAEEFSQETLERNGVEKTISQEVASSFGVRHKLCDPDSRERRELRIPSREEIKAKLNIRGAVFANSEQDRRIEEEKRKYHPVREKFWFDQIRGESPTTILFVCGADHLESFQSLLSKSGYKAIILPKKFILL